MNLSDLVKNIEKNSTEFEKGTIEYKGETVEFQFKKEMNVADYEGIFMRGTDTDDYSVLARRVTYLCRDADGSKFSIDDVLDWPIDLVMLVSGKTIEADTSKKKTVKKSSGK